MLRTIATPYFWLRHRILKSQIGPPTMAHYTSTEQMTKVRVAICIITFHRPVGLRRLLDSLNQLVFQGDPPDIDIIVVDNDPNGSARPVCDESRATLKWPIRYEIEPQRGISHARNKAVACALENADWLAWIDDDQVAWPRWLDELLRIQQTYGADIVTGPVTPRFEDAVAPWIIKGRFFEYQRYPTGSNVDVAGTGNALIGSAVFQAMEEYFDDRFALTGGEDRDFFRRAHRAGYSIIWADKAESQEWIPKSRTSFSWIITRQFVVGNAHAAVDLKHLPGWRTQFALVGRAVFWSGVGVVGLLFSLVRGRHMMIRGFRFMAYAAGTLTAMFGSRYEAYRTIQGS